MEMRMSSPAQHCMTRPRLSIFESADRFVASRYVRSRADNQMAGEGTDASSCSPQRYIDGAINNSLPNAGVINPCGLIAWSFFNDTYTLQDSSGNAVPIDVRHLHCIGCSRSSFCSSPAKNSDEKNYARSCPTLPSLHTVCLLSPLPLIPTPTHTTSPSSPMLNLTFQSCLKRPVFVSYF